MTIRRRAGSALLATAAMAAASIGLFATPAVASTPHLTITVTGGGTFTATASKTVLSDKGNNVTCTSKGRTPASSASGKIASGTYKGAVPVKIGTASKLAFNNCTGILGPVTTKVLKEPYLTKIDSKTNSKGQTDGIIAGVKTQVTIPSVGCTFTVSGSAPGYYTNSKHTLTMAPKLPITPLVKARLTVSKVNSCAGLINNGDHPTFSSTFTLSRKGTIKST